MQLLTFFLKEERFAIDISLVDTIEKKMPMTVVPKTKEYFAGLVSHRGNVIPVIHTNLILKDALNMDGFEKLIIINLENKRLALAVTEIDDVLDIEESNIEIINEKEGFSIVNFSSDIITLLTLEQLKNI